MSSVVIHPLFEECKNYTLDTFWKDTFEACARNRFPEPIARYDPTKGCIYVKKAGKKTYDVISIPKIPVDAFKAMMKIFREELGIVSAKDVQIQNNEVEDARKKHGIDLHCEWKKLKPRYIKDQLLINYYSKLRDKYKLTSAEIKNLQSVVQIGLQFHQFSSDDIDYRDCEVQDIKGLVFDEKKRVFYSVKPPVVSSKTEKTCSQNRFIQHYDKYLKDYSMRSK